MPDDDLAYFERRAEEEVERAQEATLPEVVAAHYSMSELYLQRVALARESRREAGASSQVGVEAAVPARSIDDNADD